MSNEYKCSICQQTFEKGWSDEEALAELKENFDRDSADDCELVCDDCFNNIEFNAAKSLKQLRSEARKNMADLYKKIRKENPVFARLLFKANKVAEKAMLDTILYGVGYVESSFDNDIFTINHIPPKLD